MQDLPISALNELANAAATDELIVVRDGENFRVKAGDLREALAVASVSAKGLMSAADKANLAANTTDIAGLKNRENISIVAQSSITIPANVTHVSIIGSTPITNISFLGTGVQQVFISSAGGTVSVLGQQFNLQDAPLHIVHLP